ncbi:hypothetical protein GCM10023196_037540 [Actinoallomurus vinaceus]|uniref:Secreted protein n=1 Tax=Actinoallomurus vinaceus TaxID=1080074 RepID=A0ABP8UB67_9ACTN
MIKVVACFAVVLVAMVAAAWIVTALLLCRSKHRQEARVPRHPAADPTGTALIVCIAVTDPDKHISDPEWRAFLKAHGLRTRWRG